jgi:hypothetical protein
MESKKKMRCWNYNECGHEKDSLCPAVAGNTGKPCWLVAKTLCGGKVHGRHAQRTKSCEGCAFYIYIHLRSRPLLEEQSCEDTRRVAEIRRGRLSFI